MHVDPITDVCSIVGLCMYVDMESLAFLHTLPDRHTIFYSFHTIKSLKHFILLAYIKSNITTFGFFFTHNMQTRTVIYEYFPLQSTDVAWINSHGGAQVLDVISQLARTKSTLAKVQTGHHSTAKRQMPH